MPIPHQIPLTLVIVFSHLPMGPRTRFVLHTAWVISEPEPHSCRLQLRQT